MDWIVRAQIRRAECRSRHTTGTTAGHYRAFRGQFPGSIFDLTAQVSVASEATVSAIGVTPNPARIFSGSANPCRSNASASRANGPSQISTDGAYGISKGASPPSSHEGKYERDYAQQHGVRKVGLDQRQLSMRVLPSGGTYVCTCSPLMTFENMPRLRLSSTQPLMDLIMSIPLSERGTDNRESSWRPRLDLN